MNWLKRAGAGMLAFTLGLSPLTSLTARAESTLSFEAIAVHTASSVFTAPEKGTYRFHVIGAGGSGGRGSNAYNIPASNPDAAGQEAGGGGGSGGYGGYAIHEVLMQKGESATVVVTSDYTKIIIGSTAVTANKGGDGGAAPQASMSWSGGTSFTRYSPGGIGGLGGTASGGNILNLSGDSGNIGIDGLAREGSGARVEYALSSQRAYSQFTVAGGEYGTHYDLSHTESDYDGKTGYFTANSAALPNPFIGCPGSGGGGATLSTYLSPGYYIIGKGGAGGAGQSGGVVVESYVDDTPPVIGTAALSPTGWAKSCTVTVSATDNKSGVAGYALTTVNFTPSSGWQTSGVFPITSNGTYYAWAKDVIGNVCAGYPISVTTVDLTGPQITRVTVPDSWAQTSNISIAATDTQSGISQYACSLSNTVPANGWQNAGQFTLTLNGVYYAWVRDTVGNVSVREAFTVSKVDRTPPAISNVTVPNVWGQTNIISIAASDAQSGILEYACTAEHTAPSAGWQGSHQFTLTQNGTYYAWVKDKAGNISDGRVFSLNSTDRDAPSITNAAFSSDSTRAVVTADDGAGSGVRGIYVNGIFCTGNPVETAIPRGTYSLMLQAEDKAGNRSDARAVPVPDKTAPEVAGVTFSDDNTQAAVKITDEGGSGVKGVHINGSFFAGDSVVYPIPEGIYRLAFQAEDQAGNLSLTRTISVPDKLAPEISKVEYAPDSSYMDVTMTDDGGSGIKGIYVNGSLYTGNPARIPIPKGVFRVMLQAEDHAGNRSAVRWETVPDVIPPTVDNILFAADGSGVLVTASDSGSSGLRGVHIGAQFCEGGYITCEIPKGTRYLDFQAEDNAGNLSRKTTRRVSGWSEQVGTISITGVTFSDDSRTVRITAETTKAGASIRGIRINDVFLEGSDVTYIIPENTRYLTIQAKDNEGDYSATKTVRVPGWSEQVGTISITGVTFSDDNKTADISAETTKEGASIQGITINGTFLAGADVTFQIPEDTRYLEIQAKDNEGDYSATKTVRVPGWSEQVGAISITSVTFSEDNKTADISAETTKEGASIQGITINGTFLAGADVTFQIPEDTRYLEIQAKDNEGDYSATKTVRVPGWSEQVGTISITSVTFSEDNKTADISAGTTKEGASIQGITVNGTFLAGADVTFQIPEDTRYLEIQAKDNEGDYSATKTVRVPGWSEQVGTISITGVTFSDDNKTADISAETTKEGASIQGITVNGTFLAGADVTYPIPEDMRYLEIQAKDNEGDYSATQTVRVPGWGEVVDTLRITGTKFSEDAKTISVEAETTKMNAQVSGVYLNGSFFDGNPADCIISEGTRYIEL